jgi:hypothetical protein
MHSVRPVIATAEIIVVHVAGIDRRCVIASPAQQRAIVRATMAAAVDLALAEMAGA